MRRRAWKRRLHARLRFSARLSLGIGTRLLPETVIAEKCQAVVALGVINGRMKDYYDLWALPKAVDLDPEDLLASIEKTFERRTTEVPKERPPGLSQEFATDPTKSAQWHAYSEATEIEGMSLAQVVDDIWTTLEPI
ncbi:hypothetical protein DU478_20790 [Thalassococcus profundi]|uniref:Nucleotidyl transferase AbiEii/AbiGii toxin family protein n=1 Tax=Thalassococcus profundi TaxID=2282382 RepID=A0A369TJN2_9RHOB|nr:hypothetical protein DU478_20790 [Thalassococcus profundi]